jgi:hypothetical protein
MENQGWYYGYKNEKGNAEVTQRFREMYYPLSEGWRSEVTRKSREILNAVSARHRGMQAPL